MVFLYFYCYTLHVVQSKVVSHANPYNHPLYCPHSLTTTYSFDSSQNPTKPPCDRITVRNEREAGSTEVKIREKRKEKKRNEKKKKSRLIKRCVFKCRACILWICCFACTLLLSLSIYIQIPLSLSLPTKPKPKTTHHRRYAFSTQL